MDALLTLVEQGGSGGNGGGSELRYFSCDSNAPVFELLTKISALGKDKSNIIPVSAFSDNAKNSIVAFAISPYMEIISLEFNAPSATSIDAILASMAGGDWVNAFAQMGVNEITKEQFYTI